MTVGPNLSRRAALVATVGGAVAAPFVLRSRIVRAAAPMLGPDRPTHYRFKLGSFEVTTLLDGYVHLDGPNPIFGMDESAEAVQAYAAENRLPTNRMETSLNQSSEERRGGTAYVINSRSWLWSYS